ncbi:MAG: thioredoxin-like domain-containing protein, partial [Chitinophagales bacterium]
MKKIFSICIAALLGLSSWSMTTKAQQTAINIGQPVPNIMLPTKKGVVSGLDALQGKYVYLVFWASTCPNSQKEIGNWRALHQRYHSTSFADANGFEVYSVSMDENSAAWQNVAKANPWTNDCYDVQGFSSAVAQRFDIFALPSNLIIDPRGLVIGKDLNMDEVDALLKGRETATPSLQQSLIQQSANTAAKNIWEQGDLEKMSNVTGIPSFNPSSPVAPTRNFAPIPPTSALSNVVKNNGNKNRPYNNGGETKTQTIFLPPVYTKIQVGAFSTLAFHRLNHLNDLGLIEQETTANGLTRVLIGTFTNQHTIDYVLKEAKKRGYKDAYTVQYFDGQRINSDTQLTKLIAQKRQQMETERLAARQVEPQLQPKRSMTTTQSPNAVATYTQPKQATGGTFYDTYNNNANSSTATVNGFDRSKAGNTTPNRNTGGVGAFKPGETKAVNSVNANAVYYQTPKQTKNSTGIKPISTPNKSTGVRMYQPPTKNNTNTLNNTPSQNKRNGNTMYYQAPKQTTKPSSNSPKNTDASTNTPSRNGIDVNTIYDKPNTPTSKNEASLGSVQTKTTPSKAAEMTISPSKPITNNTSATPTIKAPIKPTKSDVNKTVETKPVEQNATKPSPNTKSTLVTKTKIPVGNAYTQKSNRKTTAKETAISTGKTDVKIPVGNAYTQKSNRKTTAKETAISAGKTDVKIPVGNAYTQKSNRKTTAKETAIST